MALLHAQTPDLLITDIFMPSKDGIEVTVEPCRGSRGFKIIAISGGSRLIDKDFLEFAEKLGADRVLAKPFGPDRLVEMVRTLLQEDPLNTARFGG